MNTEVLNRQVTAIQEQADFNSRFFAMSYALVAYSIGAGALFWFFFASIGVAPASMLVLENGSLLAALCINLLLVAAFGVQHSVMARPAFKAEWTKIVPPHLERSTYVLASGLFLLPIIVAWQPLPGQIWLVEQETVAFAIKGIAVFGFAYLLLASFFTNHFELFGLRQAWLYATQKQYTPLEFKRNWLYGFSRHPIMTGLLIMFWATPDMTMTRFLLSLFLNAYIVIGVWFEEKDLVAEFGDTYRQYRKEIGAFFTIKRK